MIQASDRRAGRGGQGDGRRRERTARLQRTGGELRPGAESDDPRKFLHLTQASTRRAVWVLPWAAGGERCGRFTSALR
jgi:hypothetical protein